MGLKEASSLHARPSTACGIGKRSEFATARHGRCGEDPDQYFVAITADALANMGKPALRLQQGTIDRVLKAWAGRADHVRLDEPAFSSGKHRAADGTPCGPIIRMSRRK